jgi:hypothetical protein
MYIYCRIVEQVIFRLGIWWRFRLSTPPSPLTQFKIQSFSRNINIQISAGEKPSAVSITTVDPFLLN